MENLFLFQTFCKRKILNVTYEQSLILIIVLKTTSNYLQIGSKYINYANLLI